MDYKMYLLGWLTSLGTAWFVQYLKDKKADEKLERQKRSFAALFISLTVSYELHLEVAQSTPWENKLWDTHQARISFFFPEETAIFSWIVLEVAQHAKECCEDGTQAIPIASVSAALQRIREELRKKYKLGDLQLDLEKMLSSHRS